LQNKALRTIGSFPRRTSVRDMHLAFRIPYVYDYITKSYRQQAEVIQNHENENVRYIVQGEADTRNTKGLDLVVVMFTTVQVSRLPLWRELLVSSRAQCAVPSRD
jgi:hypothetical protein